MDVTCGQHFVRHVKRIESPPYGLDMEIFNIIENKTIILFYTYKIEIGSYIVED